MVSRKSVDRLNISREMSLGRIYKDCIYRKYIAYLYSTNTIGKETELLKKVYINIWKPVQIQLVEGVNYFMIIMDKYLLFYTVAFLNSKLANITLKVFCTFYTKTK